MRRLREFIKETGVAASVTAGDIAGFRGSLFSKPISRKIENKNKIKVKKIQFDKKNLKESLLYTFLYEANNNKFSAIDVISKLKAASKKSEFEKDTVAFGLENDKGKIIKVYVRSNQANDFEKALSELLNSSNEDFEIPELLFILKNKFEIVHVEWGKIEEDEEQTATQSSQKLDNKDDEQQMDLPQTDSDSQQTDDETLDFDNMSTDEENVKSVLDKVIDMLKADAAAREAEAKAKEAEAQAKEAEYAARAAEAKIKGEEEVLDAEAFFRQQEEEKKEARKLAKLAKYRHEKAAIEKQNVDL